MKKLFYFLLLTLLISNNFACKKTNSTPSTSNMDCSQCTFKSSSKTKIPIGTNKGCGDFVVLQVVAKDLVAQVYFDHKIIKYSTDFQEFTDIIPAGTAIGISQHCDLENYWANLCNDVLIERCKEQRNWKFTKGKVSYKVSKVFSKYDCATEMYKANVIVENADFQLENTIETIHFDKIEFKDVEVGWCPG